MFICVCGEKILEEMFLLEFLFSGFHSSTKPVVLHACILFRVIIAMIL